MVFLWKMVSENNSTNLLHWIPTISMLFLEFTQVAKGEEKTNNE
jgi:hypothetical protein